MLLGSFAILTKLVNGDSGVVLRSPLSAAVHADPFEMNADYLGLYKADQANRDTC